MTNDDRPVLEIGRIGRPHGLKGEVAVTLLTDQTDVRAAPGARWFVGPDRIPVEVLAARPHQERWLVTFEGYTDRNQVEKLRSLVCYAEAVENPDVVFVHDLVGRRVVDQHGTDWGPVVAVIDNPASDLMELESGGLIPLAFYLEHDDGMVRVDVPVGLLDDAEG